jgi:3-phosphoshikimate 1-carboxyvinyltransferase
LQGDYGFVDVLAQMGCVVVKHENWTKVTGPAKLKGIDVDMFHISDTVMTLAALAPLAEGPTTIRNIANIRIKETDRLVAIVNELKRLGQGVEHGEDWITSQCSSQHTNIALPPGCPSPPLQPGVLTMGGC